jgi:ubiquinone/menaquinone biosynthesis C-methylase UbiE
VQRLELGDAVDGVRTERVLMYVPDQQRAISELARVVRPGGRVVAFELDYGALEADAYQHWLAAAQDAERGGYHSDTFVGMVVSARKPEPGPA